METENKRKFMSNVGPYRYVTADLFMKFQKQNRTFRVVLYGAYFKNGILRTSNNGIAIMDQDLRAVVCDGICQDKNALIEPTKYQDEALSMILHWSWNDFVKHINSNPRSRGPIVEELPKEN